MTIDTGVQKVFGHAPVVPHDESELRHILTLIEKVPLYLEKMTELTARVQEFAKIASQQTAPLTYSYEIERMIFRAFFIELENRKFEVVSDNCIRSLKGSLKLEGVISARNYTCEVCGENRSTDRCHIIPAKLGGSSEANNILVLCPTHHRLYDRFMLSRGEYAAIDWGKKSVPSQHYANNVTFEAHEKFWKSIELNEFRCVKQYDRETKPFIKYVLSQILEIFAAKKLLKKSSVYKVLDPNLQKLAKKIIPHLIKKGILIQNNQEADGFFALAQPNTVPTDELVLRIWQQVG